MANYVIKEMPTGMSKSEGSEFPKMQVYTEFSYDKVVELVHTYSPSFSPATIRGVLDTLAVAMKSCLPLGHTMKIDNLGVFSLSLQFDDEAQETADAKDADKGKYRRVKVKGVNFKVDQRLVDDINRENSFERVAGNAPTPSPYSLEERVQRALRHIDKHGYVTLQEYANIGRLSYSTASRELAKLVTNPQWGIRAKGSGSHKVWVRAN